MNTIMTTTEFIETSDRLKKEKASKCSDLISQLLIMRGNRPLAVFADGFHMSIQASDGHYSSKDENGNYKSVEIGFPSQHEPLLDRYEDVGGDVFGYVPLVVVDKIIAKHGGILPDSFRS